MFWDDLQDMELLEVGRAWREDVETDVRTVFKGDGVETFVRIDVYVLG